MSFRTTAQILQDPVLAAWVEQLAQAERIESAHIGEGGTPSDVHATFARLSKQLSGPQAVALLAHQSPVVRGYLADYVVAALPDEASAVYPLLADATAVEEMSGCCIAGSTVAEVALGALRTHRDRPAVQELLLRAAQDAQLGALRAEALQLVAAQRPTEAAAVAQALLREQDAKLVAGALRTLGMAAASASAPAVCAFADAPSDEVRAAVAAALGSLRGDGVLPALGKLVHDGVVYVRMLAGSSYARQPARDLAVLRRLLTDAAPRVRSYTAETLAAQAGTEDLALLKEYLAAYPDSTEPVTALRKTRSDAVAAFMRELLGSNREALVRAQAISHLRDVQDRRSLPLFKKSLTSSYIGERTAAAEALGELGEHSAVPALVALLADGNPHGRLAAARALVKLRAVSARAAVDRAVAADTSWAKEELSILAAQLRS